MPRSSKRLASRELDRYVFLLLALTIWLVSATIPASAQEPRSGVSRVVGPAASSAAAGSLHRGLEPVLYDQTLNPSTFGFSSQDFTDAGGGNDGFDATGADDFIVPPEMVWEITGVDVPGFFGAGQPGPVDTVDIVFSSDGGGVPGAAICTYDALVPTSQVAGALVLDLPVPCLVPEGPAWMSVQSALPLAPNGQWFWFLETVQTNESAVWRNPGDGFGSGCTTFMPVAGCGAQGPDFSFVLRGVESRAATPLPVPTLGLGALALMTLLLMAAALATLRR